MAAISIPSEYELHWAGQRIDLESTILDSTQKFRWQLWTSTFNWCDSTNKHATIPKMKEAQFADQEEGPKRISVQGLTYSFSGRA
jgi:hypothetical protein